MCAIHFVHMACVYCVLYATGVVCALNVACVPGMCHVVLCFSVSMQHVCFKTREQRVWQMRPKEAGISVI